MRRDRERGLMAAEGAEKAGGVIVHPHDFAAQYAGETVQYRRTSLKFPPFGWLCSPCHCDLYSSSWLAAATTLLRRRTCVGHVFQ